MKTIGILTALALAAVAAAGWQSLNAADHGAKMGSKVGTRPGGVGDGTALKPGAHHKLAAFSGGCFWGTEERFRQIPGIVATAVGYTGGSVAHPTYEQVSTHSTGHAETVLVEYDPAKVSYEKLVKEFWGMHDPTTLNRQGPDVGANYRSAIWYFDDEQKRIAEASRAREQKELTQPITTQISPAAPFWLAEEYHQQYDEKNGIAACPLPQAPRKHG